MHKAVDDALKCTHPGRRWKRKYKRAKRAIIMSHKEKANMEARQIIVDKAGEDVISVTEQYWENGNLIVRVVDYDGTGSKTGSSEDSGVC